MSSYTESPLCILNNSNGWEIWIKIVFILPYSRNYVIVVKYEIISNFNVRKIFKYNLLSIIICTVARYYLKDEKRTNIRMTLQILSRQYLGNFLWRFIDSMEVQGLRNPFSVEKPSCQQHLGWSRQHVEGVYILEILLNNKRN